jgi:hypothetical protein
MATLAALVIVVVIVVLGSESRSAKNLSGLRRTNGYKAADAEESFRFRQGGGLQDVSDFH